MFIKKICLTVLVLAVFVSCGIANVAYIDGYDVHDEKMKPWDHGWLEVSSNGQYLQHEDGTPLYFWFDTAWAVPTRLDLDDLRTYFADRQEKGYSGVIMSVLGFGGYYDYDNTADNLVNGTTPLLIENPLTANPDHFHQMADAINLAAEYNLYVVLLVATGGDYVCNSSILTTANAYAYGQWIGDFFKDDTSTPWREFPNLIIAVGGDMDFSCTTSAETIITNLVLGIKDRDTNHLVTAHPSGRKGTWMWSSLEVALDFGSFQSSDFCCAANDTYGLSNTAYSKNKAYINSEPHYIRPVDSPYVLTDVDMRSQPWFTWLRGTKGYIGGVHFVWGVFIEALGEFGNESGNWAEREGYDWDWYLDNSDGNDYEVLAHQLLKKFNWHKLVPDQSIITNNNSPSDVWHKRTAAYSSDGDFMLVYVPKESDPTTTLEINLNGYITAAPYAHVRLWRASNGFERAEGIEATNTNHSISLPSWDGTLVIVEAIDTYHVNPDKTSNARYKTDTYHGYFGVP